MFADAGNSEWNNSSVPLARQGNAALYDSTPNHLQWNSSLPHLRLDNSDFLQSHLELNDYSAPVVTPENVGLHDYNQYYFNNSNGTSDAAQSMGQPMRDTLPPQYPGYEVPRRPQNKVFSWNVTGKSILESLKINQQNTWE